MTTHFAKRLLFLVALAGGAAACGSQYQAPAAPSTSTSVSNNHSGDLLAALNCKTASAALTGDALGLTDAATSAALPQLRHVPADDLNITWQGQSKTLCDLLRGTGQQLALFQFVSVKCYDCMKWVDSMNSEIASQNLTSSVLSVPIVVDPATELTDAEVQDLKGEVAPNATWVRDLDGSVWNFFSPTADANVSPLTIAMDWNARGFACNQDQTPLSTLVQISDQLMGLSLGKK